MKRSNSIVIIDILGMDLFDKQTMLDNVGKYKIHMSLYTRLCFFIYSWISTVFNYYFQSFQSHRSFILTENKSHSFKKRANVNLFDLGFFIRPWNTFIPYENIISFNYIPGAGRKPGYLNINIIGDIENDQIVLKDSMIKAYILMDQATGIRLADALKHNLWYKLKYQKDKVNLDLLDYEIVKKNNSKK